MDEGKAGKPPIMTKRSSPLKGRSGQPLKASKRKVPKKKSGIVKKKKDKLNTTIEQSFEDEESLFFKYNFSKEVSNQEKSKPPCANIN